MNRRVVITGLGVLSPIGNDIESFEKAVFNGECGITTFTEMDGKRLPISVAAHVKGFDPIAAGLTKADVRRSDLFSQFAVAASIQAMADSQLVAGENIEPERLGVYIGSGIGGINTFATQEHICETEGIDRVSPFFAPMLIANIAGGNTAIRFNAQGPCLCSISACATSTNTVGEAMRAIRHGYADAIIAGGSEAAIAPVAIGGFASCKALSMATDPLKASLPFDKRRGGFVMGEGAAVLILEEYEHARKRGAKIYAEVTGYGHTCDAYHFTSPKPGGVAVANAINAALKESSFNAGETLYINAHGTGTHLNDLTETEAFKLALGEDEARKAIISSTKSMTGHMIGATGATELIACVLALKDGLIPPTIGLEEPDPECDLDYTPLVARQTMPDIAISNSLGFGGHNACVALRPIK